MTIGTKIKNENVVFNLQATSIEEVITSLAQKLYDSGDVLNLEGFISDVLSREKQISTGIGNGMAIPHGKSKHVVQSTVAVAKLENRLDWNSFDDNPVSVVFLLAVKDGEEGNDHLRILAELSGKLMDDDFVLNIKNTKNEKELFEALSF